jgi:hypothetical protein
MGRTDWDTVEARWAKQTEAVVARPASLEETLN